MHLFPRDLRLILGATLLKFTTRNTKSRIISLDLGNLSPRVRCWLSPKRMLGAGALSGHRLPGSGTVPRSPRQRRKEGKKEKEKAQLCRLHEVAAPPHLRSKCRGERGCELGPCPHAALGAARCGARAGRRGTPPTSNSEPALRRASTRGRRPQRCKLLESPGNFPGTRRRRPHLTEHLQVVLVLVQVQHVGLQRGRGAAAARQGAAVPRLLPTGAPRREARGALRRCPALALHPESARPQAVAASPAPRSVPIGSRASCTSPAGPAPAPRPLRRRGTAGPGAVPGLIPTWSGACRTRGVGLSDFA